MSTETINTTPAVVAESSEKSQFQVERIPLKSVIGESSAPSPVKKKTTSTSATDKATNSQKTKVPSSRTTQIQNITQAVQKEIDRLIKLSQYYQSRSPKSFSAYRMEKLIEKIRTLHSTIENLKEASSPDLINLYRQFVLGEK